MNPRNPGVCRLHTYPAQHASTRNLRRITASWDWYYPSFGAPVLWKLRLEKVGKGKKVTKPVSEDRLSLIKLYLGPCEPSALGLNTGFCPAGPAGPVLARILLSQFRENPQPSISDQIPHPLTLMYKLLACFQNESWISLVRIPSTLDVSIYQPPSKHFLHCIPFPSVCRWAESLIAIDWIPITVVWITF